MAKQNQASDVKCPQCGSTEFTVAVGADMKPRINGNHYCSKCGHVWVPGVKIEGRSDLVIQTLRKENEELKTALERERKKTAALMDELAELKPGQESSDDESDIFK